jgi:hypothetical protein
VLLLHVWLVSLHSDAELQANEEECRRAFVADPASMVDRQDLLLDVFNPSVLQSFVYQVRSWTPLLLQLTAQA